MRNPEVGKIIEDKQFRDAIHVAIAPVVAGHKLNPGQHIGLMGNDNRYNTVGDSHTKIGIVDPFLKSPVSIGEKFYMFLYPNTITSLRHEWTHPSFEKEESENSASRQWIEEFALEMSMSYRALMGAAERYAECGDYTNMGENEDYKNVDYSKWTTFWVHYEAVTGKAVEHKDGNFFSCSC